MASRDATKKNTAWYAWPTNEREASMNKKIDLEGDMIEEVRVIVSFVDGTKKEFSENSVSSDFKDWLHNLSVEKKIELKE